MDGNKVDMYIMTNNKYFPAEKVVIVKEKLLKMDESKFSLISSIELKDPNIMLLISIFLGSLGVDRFMIGDIAMGVLKLLTMGLCGILTIVDWFTISNKTKELNYNNLMRVI